MAGGVVAVLEIGLLALFFVCPSEQNNACRAPVVIRPPGILFMTLRLGLMSLQRSTTRRAAIQPQQKTIARPPRALSVLSEQSTVL